MFRIYAIRVRFIPEYSKVKIIAKLPIFVKKLLRVLLRKIAPRMAVIA